ncbi:semaphorin-4E-like isoform X1 [Ornithorhynchus anatinus]|uniref:semaphorin-4E-like isoform X1 n=1 Tax=Ornithorhynchus anatinus TaxID=9258 RepID=UPI0007AA7C99|nr:semaphorin-4E-like isoform X1 [Ornithorhynchus anatinus]
MHSFRSLMKRGLLPSLSRMWDSLKFQPLSLVARPRATGSLSAEHPKMNNSTAVLFLGFVCGLIQQMEASLHDYIPRKTVKYSNDSIKAFVKMRYSDFSTLLLDEEIEILFIGAKEAVFAVDMNDITQEIAHVFWHTSEERQQACVHKGKSQVECQNYILLLHKITDTTFYVCGSNAFHPSCDFMMLNKTKMFLKGKAEESRGNCPFGLTLKYSSVLVDGALFSATYSNFLGTAPVIFRGLKNHLKTEFKKAWLNDPSFVHMDVVQESKDNPSGDDDKIYVFFSETAVEFEFYDKLLVSRIARVCKNDLGGRHLLQNKWTSFLKATLICSAPESNFQFNVVQDVFLLKTADWKETVFYGIFLQQWGKLDNSAICAFSMEAVHDVFSKGEYKEPVTIAHSQIKWIRNRQEVPVPRPGACIDNFARGIGYHTSLDLPDKTIQFVRDHPLMDDTVKPIGNRPVLLKRGSNYTRIVVDRIIGLDKKTYDVLFLATDNGYLHKALNCDGDVFIVEEVQLFQSLEPVQSLRISSKKGLLYIGSASQVVQLPVSVCSRYKRCLDCVLARDPYCAWAQHFNECVPVAHHKDTPESLLQNIKTGEALECPRAGSQVRNYLIEDGTSIHLKCAPLSNLANTLWMFNGESLKAKESKYLFSDRGLVIFNVMAADAGRYDCQSVERANGKEFLATMASYILLPQSGGLARFPQRNPLGRPRAEAFRLEAKPSSWEASSEKLLFEIFLSLFVCLFLVLLAWNFGRGHIHLPRSIRERLFHIIRMSHRSRPGLDTREQWSHSQQNSLAITSTSSLLPLFTTSIEDIYRNMCSNNNVNREPSGQSTVLSRATSQVADRDSEAKR